MIGLVIVVLLVIAFVVVVNKVVGAKELPDHSNFPHYPPDPPTGLP